MRSGKLFIQLAHHLVSLKTILKGEGNLGLNMAVSLILILVVIMQVVFSYGHLEMQLRNSDTMIPLKKLQHFIKKLRTKLMMPVNWV